MKITAAAVKRHLIRHIVSQEDRWDSSHLEEHSKAFEYYKSFADIEQSLFDKEMRQWLWEAYS